MIITVIIMIGCLLLCIPLSKQLYWKYSSIILILVAAGYFFYTPPSQDDLYRHYLMLDEIHEYGINFFDTTNHYWDENPVYVMFLAFVSIFQANPFLPFFTGIIYYLVSLYGIYLSSLKDGIYQREILGSILLLISTNYISISGIRNILGAGIFLIGIYFDLIQKKKIGYFYYVIASLIHSSMFIYLFIRILLFFYRGKKKILVLVLMFVFPLLLTYFSNSLYGAVDNLPIIGSVIGRFQMYTIENIGMETSTNWRLVTAFNYVFIFSVALIYELSFDCEKQYNDIFHLIMLVIIFAFGFFDQRELFSRHYFVLMPLGIMYFVLLKNQTFIRFPFIACIRDRRGLVQNIAPIICLLYFIWSIANFLILAGFSYPFANSNFQF